MGTDIWQVVNTRPQTEHECGVRMGMYMLKFRTWATEQMQSNEIGVKIGRLMVEEKGPKDLAAKYRRSLHSALKEE